jgi:very-short-patch-repair endonuclease
MRRKTPADYHILAKEKGLRWLGPEVPNTKTKTRWGCEQGHVWEARYNGIQQGKGCPFCAGKAPKTALDYHTLAEGRRFRWVGPEVSNIHTKTSWECEKGHQWQATYHNIQQGSGCPVCAGKVPKTPADYHALAEERGFCWLGPEVSNIHTKTSWECEKGHHWQATYHNIQQGSSCPVCYGNVPKTSADYHTLAEERGFRWLGPEVPNVTTKTVWECEQGHRWEAPYSYIQQGRGCPVCADRVPKTPSDYHALARERGFRWLGPDVPDTRTKTIWECENGHPWEATYNSIRQGSGCPVCYGNVPKTPADYHDLAEERGFRWLGPEVSNTHTNTVWECEQGHRWETPYSCIQQGRGCPVCYGKLPKTPADYHDLAKERGFRWLGPEVSNTGVKTGWECEYGHSWEATYDNVRQGSGCPYCAGKAPKTPADYHALAKERGFHWLGPEVPDNRTKTWWECEQGHRWEAPYNYIQQGNGCPTCVDVVRGAQVSQVQRDLCEMLGGELNHPFGRYSIDVALDINGVAIAVEYDSWFWHGDREEYDARRDEDLLGAGWRVLRIKSNKLLPTRGQLDRAINRLMAGENRVEVVLDDWGEGQSWRSYHDEGNHKSAFARQ